MARKKATVASLWVVQRLAVSSSRWTEEISLYLARKEDGGVPLTGLATEKAARTQAARLEAEARRTTPIGPFLGTFLPDDLAKVVAAATKAGLPAIDVSAVGEPVGPTPWVVGGRVMGQSYGSGYFDYSKKVRTAVGGWWDERAAEITPQQNAALWDELFPEPCFYGVQRVLLG